MSTNKRRPPPPASGSATKEEIYCAVGHAISNWEKVESAKLKAFQILTNANYLTAVRVFGSVDSSQARHTMILAALEIYFLNYPRNYKRAKKFLGDIGPFIGLRNDCAHGWYESPRHKL